MGICVDQEGPLVVTLGALMLRLKSPGNERLFQSPTLEATLTGGEANVAVSLADFRLRTRYEKLALGHASGRISRSYRGSHPTSRS
jgi:2-dehydro-3-deoxygluconokinase